MKRSHLSSVMPDSLHLVECYQVQFAGRKGKNVTSFSMKVIHSASLIMFHNVVEKANELGQTVLEWDIFWLLINSSAKIILANNIMVLLILPIQFDFMPKSSF